MQDGQLLFEADVDAPVIRYSEVVFSGYDSTKSFTGEAPKGGSIGKPWEESIAQSPLAFQANEPSFVRFGEQVKVVAINRATGYVGSTIATLGGNGGINSFANPISFNPPNIKVHVKRYSIVQYGITAGEDRENVISFEGAGLTSDEMMIKGVRVNHCLLMLKSSITS